MTGVGGDTQAVNYTVGMHKVPCGLFLVMKVECYATGLTVFVRVISVQQNIPVDPELLYPAVKSIDT